MRRILTALVVLGQLMVLGAIAGEREYVVRFGRTIYLRSAPIDPRDAFRGDFVRLDYEISMLPLAAMRDTLKDHVKERDRLIYAILAEGPENLASLDHATDVAPEQGLYIRGRLTGTGPFAAGRGAAQVRYGIEQLFVEQGAGRAIEERRGARDGLQVPLEVKVAVSGRGTAVITGHRWSRLGVKLEVLWASRRNRNDDLDQVEGPLSPKLRVSLKNVSDHPLAVVNPGRDCGFELRPVVWTLRDYEIADRSCEGVRPDDGDVVLLEPEAVHAVELDLSEPRWHLSAGGRVSEMGRLEHFDRFRLVYRSPDEAALTGLSAPQMVWRGSLPTRAFDAFGRID